MFDAIEIYCIFTPLDGLRSSHLILWHWRLLAISVEGIQHVWRDQNILADYSTADGARSSQPILWHWKLLTISVKVMLKMLHSPVATTCLPWSKYTVCWLYRWCQMQSSHSWILRNVDYIYKNNVENVVQPCTTCLTQSKYTVYSLYRSWCQIQSSHSLT